jgi:hypothetical protein
MENLDLVHTYIGGPSHVSCIGAIIIILVLLMTRLRNIWFIAFEKNIMALILLRNLSLWLRMRQEIS